MLKIYPFSKQNIIFPKILFFPQLLSTVRLDHNIRKVGSVSVFKNNILKFIRPTPNSVFNNYENHRGMILIRRLRVGLNHLREHKFKQSFQDTLIPICSWGFDVESTSHDVLHYPIYNDKKHTLLSTIKKSTVDC